jgi:replicative DNA helicase
VSCRATSPAPDRVDNDVARLRTPPHSIEAEQSVLGGLLLDNGAWDRVGDLLTESDFYRYEHQAIYKAIGDLVSAGKPVDVILLYERLQALGKHEECGGITYLNAVAQSVPSAANIRRYAEVVRERAVLRKLIEAGDEMATAAYNPQGRSVAQIVEDAEARVLRISDEGQRGAQGFVNVDQVVGEIIDRVSDLHERGADAVIGISTSIAQLDAVTAGLQPGDLIALAARASTGKTAFALNIAKNVAVQEELPVVVFSMEMSASKLSMRLLAAVGRIDHDHLRTGRLSDAEWGRLAAAVDALKAGAPIAIDAASELTVREMRARARRKARELGRLGLVVVDYLQLLRGDGDRRQTRADELDGVAAGLKAMAMELQCPVLALTTLNRGVEDRASPRPRMSDLRGSGGIEYAVDLALGLWRERDVKSEGRSVMGLSVMKNRDGQADVAFALDFFGNTQQWAESADDLDEPSHARGHAFRRTAKEPGTAPRDADAYERASRGD